MILILIPAWISVWIIQLSIKTPVMLLGLIMVLFTYRYKNTPLKDTPAILKPWINPEDQFGGYPGYEDSLPPFWKKREGTGRYAHWFYNAVRNPSDGLRSYPILQCKLEPEKIKYRTNVLLDRYEPRHMEQGKVYWYVAWRGVKAGIKVNYVWSDDRYFEFKFGYRLDPRDAKYAPAPGSTFDVLGVSMASKFLPYRKY